jgi:Zn-dependent M28 family amino/carboxypeptidase
MKKVFILFSMFLLLASSLAAQTSNQTSAKNASGNGNGAGAAAAKGAVKSKYFNAGQLINDIKILSADDMEGRRVGTPGGIKAREFVVKRFKESGLQAFGGSYEQKFEFANRAGAKFQGANVVGYIEGKKNAKKYVVVTAHYDHVGVRNGEIYNGADDDASGTAALFALAEYFRKNRPSHSIIFAAFDAEEGGLHGSRKFVAEPPVGKESILVNVNMDMVSRNEKGELYAVGTYHYPTLKTHLEKIAKNARVKLLFGHEGPNVSPQDDWTSQSDHFSFHQAKIPFIYFGVEDHKDYHQPTDDFENIDPTFYVRAVETILEAVKGLDKDLSA